MKTSVFIALAVLAAVAFALTASGGLRTAHAQAECVEIEGGAFCVSLDPEIATNEVGTTHTVTATVTFDDQPLDGVLVAIWVDEGPNAGDFDEGLTDASGQFSFSYIGDGGPGTDIIGACDIVEELGPCVEPVTLDVATKEWVQTTPAPTPTPTPAATATPTSTPAGLPSVIIPTPTPTPTPTAVAATPTPTATPTPAPTDVLAAQQLPRTGGTPSDGGSLPWPALAAGVIALISGGLALACRTRRIR